MSNTVFGQMSKNMLGNLKTNQKHVKMKLSNLNQVFMMAEVLYMLEMLIAEKLESKDVSYFSKVAWFALLYYCDMFVIQFWQFDFNLRFTNIHQIRIRN